MKQIVTSSFLCLLVVVTFHSPRIVHAQPLYGNYAGDWVGTGWGWEVRFKQKAKDFVHQFSVGGANVGQNLQSQNDATIMTLLVEHATIFNLYVDSSGAISGQGTITYNLIPNLCGLAALTEQVNGQVNMMDKIATVFNWSSDVGKKAVDNLNKDWYEEENKLATTIDQFEQSLTGSTHGIHADPNPTLNPIAIDAWVRENNDDGVLRLVKAILKNRCAGRNYLLLNGVDCSVLSLPASTHEVEGLGSQAMGTALSVAYEFLGDYTQNKISQLVLQSQKDDKICELGANATTTAGNKLGPVSFAELAAYMAPVLAKAAVMDVATGSAPVGMLLSIPGMTQVQYYYKGLKNGPEKRTFKVKGQMVMDGGTAKMKLEMDGDVEGGDPSLTVQYMVNYKTSEGKFPTWTPFLDASGTAEQSGEFPVYSRVTETTTKTFPDAATGNPVTIQVPHDVTKETTLLMPSPFVTFHETGEHRGGSQIWQNYEYVWNAHRITEPK
jgi:hypothetical protein